MRRILFLFVILALVTTAAVVHFNAVWTVPSPVQAEDPADTEAEVRPSEGVFLIEADDVSGSVRRALDPFAERMATQYADGLRPGDTFARLVFADQAKLVDLREIRSDEDRLDLAKLEVVQPAAGRWTYFSHALNLAFEIQQERRRNRGVVFLIFTDGLLATRASDRERERQALAESASAWRQINAQIMIVGAVTSERSERGLKELAELLGARRVSIDDLVREHLIARSVEQLREPQVPAVTQTPPVPAASPWITVASEFLRRVSLLPRDRWIPGVLFVLATALFCIRAFRTARRERTETLNPTVTVASPALDLHTTVTTPSGTKRYSIHLPEDRNEWRLRFGRELTSLPGLPAGALSLSCNGGPMQLAVAAGVALKVNRVPVPLEGAVLPIGERANLEWAANAAVLDVRRRRGIESVPTVRKVVAR